MQRSSYMSGTPTRFLLFLSAVNLVRFSYVVLVHGALRTAPAEATLVCGTGAGARYALARVRAMGPLSLQPVGFIELSLAGRDGISINCLSWGRSRRWVR